jgi:hypothetical protein
MINLIDHCCNEIDVNQLLLARAEIASSLVEKV